MPFKIVETIEKGKPPSSIVPSSWERKGLLRWPPKKYAINKLVTNENSVPQADWLTIKCVLKRSSISSYSRAEEEIEMMAQYSDTSDVNDDGIINTSTNNITNYNNMAENLMHQNNETPGSSSLAAERVTKKSSNDPIIEIINDEGKIIATAVNTEQPIDIDKLFSNQKQILDNQVSIMQNQSLLHESQKEIANQEKKNIQQLQNLSVQLDYYFAHFNPQSSNVTPLGVK
ncbi:hypothetical protein O0L34_g18489 [Tuta absoluta]|nr:hypothetical protein O0L34_g18489 [Tuta absoluta]